MNTSILPQKEIKLACLISMLVLSFASSPSRVQAQLAESPSSTGSLCEETFPDNGAPTGRREGGASRNNVAGLFIDNKHPILEVSNLQFKIFSKNKFLAT